MADLADAVVRHVGRAQFGDLTPDVVERTKIAILDTMGVAAAGSQAPGCQELLQLLRAWGGAAEAGVVGSAVRLPVPAAVLANTTMARALDLDDVLEHGTHHPSVGVVPAALSVAEGLGGVSGRQFITAVAVAVDFSCRLALTPILPPSVTGISLTFQCGLFGAAAAAGKLMGLDEERLAHTLGIAYTQVHGNQQCLYESTLMIRAEQGLSSQAGVLSAYLARAGISGPREVFEGQYGYFPTFQRGQYRADRMLEGLGRDNLILDISIKPWSCCKFTHTFIDATLQLMHRHRLAPEAIEHIVAEVDSQLVYQLVCEPRAVKIRPQQVPEAQFSLPYTVAAAAVRGSLGLWDFTPPAFAEPRVLDLARRVQTVMTDSADSAARPKLPLPGKIRIHTHDGATVESTVEYCKGHPRNPMSLEEVAEKFRACVGFGAPHLAGEPAERFIHHVVDLEHLADVGVLARDLTAH